MDHLSSLDFSSGNSARFDGHDEEGVEDGIEKKIMGACFKVTKVKSYQYSILFSPQAPLNAQVGGGQLTWLGSGAWVPESVCVDWLSTNMAFSCGVEYLTENTWNLVDCRDLTPRQKCDLE